MLETGSVLWLVSIVGREQRGGREERKVKGTPIELGSVKGAMSMPEPNLSIQKRSSENWVNISQRT